MDPKLAYWTAALLNMFVVVASAFAGVRLARRGEYAAHRRRMLLSAWLVAAFLASYLVKIATLGPEPLDAWEPLYRGVLWTHEACVAAMVLAGATALVQARRLDLPRGPDSRPLAPERLARGTRIHRAAGRTAVAASLAGLLTAAWVLLGMYRRAGWF